MVDAAVGGKAVLAFGVESDLGIRGGDLYPFRFDAAEFARDSKENPSTAITGHGGRDKGTPGAVEFSGKLKFDLTTFRLALMLSSQFGKPTVVAIKHVASVTVGGSGSAYTNGSIVTFTGGGAATQATGHVVTSSGNVTSLVVDTPGSGYTSVPTVAVADGTGNTFLAVLSAADAYQAKFRLGDTQAVIGSLWAYLDEGGSYSAQVQLGRRPSELSISEDSNKRLKVDATFAPATGDTISGFAISKSSATGDIVNASAGIKKVTTRGRRNYDSNYTAHKSLYLKVTASDSATLTVKAAFDTASGATDGSGFPTPTYGTTTFVIRRPDSALAPDGFVRVVLSDGTLVGQFGENNEPYEITFGDQDLSVVDVNDTFEIPYQLAAGAVSLSPILENRLSAFHLLRTIDSASVKFDSGTVKLSRPFKPYYVNGRKLPDAIDPTGDIGGTWSFKKRLFDRAFRQKQEVATRFTIEDVARDSTPIHGLDVFEGFHIFVPQAAVTTLKSGDISTKETLEETVTLEAEQPDATPSAPAAILAPTATFDNSASYPIQINLVSRIDLTPLGV